MKTLILRGLLAAALLALPGLAVAQNPAPAESPPAPESAVAGTPAAPAAAPDVPSPAPEAGPAPTPAPPPAATPSVPAAARATPVADGEAGLRLNFRGAPLEMVLDYLSEAAGFIIVLETEVRGRLDVWSNQPLTKEEAVELLNRVLAKNGYAAIRDGRTLTIVGRDDAKKRDIQVRSGGDPTGIPKSEEIVTQIIPVRFISAVQLTRDLQPLFPESATIAANEGGNAVVVTDTLTNIRRIAQIIRALDTSIASVSAVRVFPLQYADAKALATVVRDLFSGQETSNRGNQQQQQMFRGFRGGGPPGMPGMPGGGNGGQGGSSGSARVATPRVVAVADERSNSLVVAASEEQMPIVVDLVAQVDVNVDDITELRVFHLKYSDPQEMADLLQELFPDPTTQNQGGRGMVRFGGPFGFRGANNSTGDASTRLQKESRVLAVPDLRTGSVVVSAARDLMEQIGGMIQQLDSDPAKKQKVFVYSVENTDPQAVEDVLRGLFETQNTRNRTASTRANQQGIGSQLNTRARNQQNQGFNRNNSGFGGSSFGGGSGR